MNSQPKWDALQFSGDNDLIEVDNDDSVDPRYVHAYYFGGQTDTPLASLYQTNTTLVPPMTRILQLMSP